MDYWTPSKTLRLGIHTHSMGLQPPGRRETISTKGQFLRDLPTWKGVTAVQPAGINVVELNSMAPGKEGSERGYTIKAEGEARHVNHGFWSLRTHVHTCKIRKYVSVWVPLREG